MCTESQNRLPDPVSMSVRQAGFFRQKEIDEVAAAPDSQGKGAFQSNLLEPLSLFSKRIYGGVLRAFVSRTYSNTVFYREISSGIAFHEAVHLASGNLPDVELAAKLGL